MSSFLVSAHQDLVPYVPGEQPCDKSYIKLNTNELPFPPSPLAQRLARLQAGELNLYSDPDALILRETAADVFHIDKDEIVFTNGSDEALNYALMAYCDKDHPLAFPDVTYSFYKVIADLNNVTYQTIPVKYDLSVDPDNYKNLGKTIFLANPNAPTGLCLSVQDIEEILQTNPDNIVVIDEAYADFSDVTCIPLIGKYDNLMVVRTFSKSYGMAGGRLGYIIANKKLIADINTLRNSNNPYCVDRMAMMAGVGALRDQSYLQSCIEKIRKTRQDSAKRLKELGFEVPDSQANFLFAKHPSYPGKKLYLDLKDKGILVRHFDTERLNDFIRISIGTDEQMQVFFEALKQLLEVNHD
ncbi:MAG: histidinol-phosphate transaminase [Erysipelotrichaceae bacterium]|nr:histidinol-phosphate transaminase [Erysipelotrichaceae bacterium]